VTYCRKALFNLLARTKVPSYNKHRERCEKNVPNRFPSQPTEFFSCLCVQCDLDFTFPY